jgi:hypothetical protein
VGGIDTHSASPRRHSRKASFSCRSSCARVMLFVQPGRRGTRSRALFSANFWSAAFSSSALSRNGFCDPPAEADGTLTIFTFRRSVPHRSTSQHGWWGEGRGRKRTCCKVGVCELGGAQEGVEVPLLGDGLQACGVFELCGVLHIARSAVVSGTERSEGTYPAGFDGLSVVFSPAVDDGAAEAAGCVLLLWRGLGTGGMGEMESWGKRTASIPCWI